MTKPLNGSRPSNSPSSALAREILTSHGVDPDKKGPSQASQLVALARERYDLFMSDDGRPYGVKVDGPNLALPLRGKAGLRSQLARIYTDVNGGTVPSQSALADAMTVLEGLAANADPRTPRLRVAGHDERILIDLGTTDGRCVSVGPDGWQLLPGSPIVFRRSGAMKPLPAPVREGNGLAKLRDLLNTTDEGFQLLVAWLLAAFIPDLPHPILAFRGEQGTGKSKGAAMVIGIVDPSGAPKRTAPRDLKSWSVQAFNSWAICLDNISIIPDWLSDALCRAVTGDGVVDRALFTDDDVVVLEFRRVLAITTIDAGALAGDLAERLLTIELQLIPDHKRREEAELDRAYADAHPAILASLFDLLAKVLKALPGIELTERPRMADFARVLAAVDDVTGWNTQASYKATAADAVADVLDGEPFAQAVVELIDAAGPEGLALTAAQILDSVTTPEKLPKKWPKDATRAGGQLKRLAPALRTIGIEVDDSHRSTDRRRSRIYRITASEKRRNTASAASTVSAPSSDQAGPADATTDAAATPATTSVRTSPTPDATDATADTGATTASDVSTWSDQVVSAEPDAADTADARTRLFSAAATCTECGIPLDPAFAMAGETTHPGCGTSLTRTRS
ncbi:ATP-binding protein [Streptomyces sp. NPDC050625]|uniref:ATP-binding protein n=1 Tax=Streptomyces sp. NPDC050625 TaxID=3154629 RepID=UPI00342D37C4